MQGVSVREHGINKAVVVQNGKAFTGRGRSHREAIQVALEKAHHESMYKRTCEFCGEVESEEREMFTVTSDDEYMHICEVCRDEM